MGKVRDEAASPKPVKPAVKASTGRGLPSGLTRFLANLVRPDVYKPNQGWYARLLTALGLGALLAAGLYALYNRIADVTTPTVRFGVPAAVGAVLGWFIYRLVHYPPFADFLIATEAEMNKVSWITWPELKRATIVVIITVMLMGLYLFGVDLVWQALLKAIGVLRFTSSGLGSQAG